MSLKINTFNILKKWLKEEEKFNRKYDISNYCIIAKIKN